MKTKSNDPRKEQTSTDEVFGLSWPGKAQARAEAFATETGKLCNLPGESVGDLKTEHRIIEGENLKVLKCLLPEFNNQIKLIYIDPPYNTGKQFVYQDAYQNTSHPKSTSLDLQSNRHSNWLSMMYPRLLLARDFLREDGVIFISIDDGELAHLILILNEIFGEENKIASLIWAGGRKNDSRLISVSHEYLLCYAKNRKQLTSNKTTWHETKPGLDRVYQHYANLREQHLQAQYLNEDDPSPHEHISVEMRAWYSQLPNEDPAKSHAHYWKSDEQGLYFPDNLSWPGGGGPTYEVLHPQTKKPCKVPSRGWVFATAEKMQQMISEDRIEFGADENKVPTRKRYLHETESQALNSVFYQDGRAASQRLKKMFGRKVFDHPKDEQLLARLIGAVTKKDDWVMDFFAGAGSLGHAVLSQNEIDSQARRFLLVQQAEVLDDPEFSNIAALARARLRRVIEDLVQSPIKTDKSLGFQAYRYQS